MPPIVNESTTRKPSPKRVTGAQSGTAGKAKGVSVVTVKRGKPVEVRGASKPRKVLVGYGVKGSGADAVMESVLAALVKTAVECRGTVAEVDTLDDKALFAQLEQYRGSTSVEGLVADLANLSTVTARLARLSRKAYQSPESEPEIATTLDFRAAAKRQAEAARVALIDAGELLTSGEITDKLRISRQALFKAIKANRMFAVDFKEARYYPDFFADGNLQRRPLEHVSKALGDIDGWEKWVFFTTPKNSLEGMTPLDALRNEVPEKVVVQAAQAFSER